MQKLLGTRRPSLERGMETECVRVRERVFESERRKEKECVCEREKVIKKDSEKEN